MPQASEKLRREWMDGTFIGTEKAEQYLKDAGYKLTKGWCWIIPNEHHQVTDKEASAITYLRDEWDFGYIITQEESDAHDKMTQENRNKQLNVVPSKDSDFSSPWG